MSGRVLVIRGGALGDFVLTLPALALLREQLPNVAIEVLGYPHIASLAEGRYYAEGVRSIEYGPLAGFFARNGTLSPELSEYFAGFAQVISYLYDPDGIFEANVRRAGVKQFLPAYRKPSQRHAAREWAAPLEQLALFLEDPAARLYPSATDREEARVWLGGSAGPRLALHPGSGSPSKNWDIFRWAELGRRFWEAEPEGEIVLVGGEADAEALRVLAQEWGGRAVKRAVGLSLPVLAAVLERVGRFVGHDSGVSHVAAAVGARCVLLFGPTDPAVWAPLNQGVRVVRAPGGHLGALRLESVLSEVKCLCQDPES